MREFDWNDIEKQMPYKVPEGFFESFPERMSHKAKASAMRRRMWRIVSTVSVAAVMILGVFFWNTASEKDDAVGNEYVEFASASLLSEKMDEYVSSLSDEELAEQLNYYESDVTLLVTNE